MSFVTTILLNTVTGKAHICVLYNVWTVRVIYFIAGSVGAELVTKHEDILMGW